MKDKKIQVAMFCSSMNELGGKNYHFMSLYHNLNDERIKVTLFFCSKVEDKIREILVKEGVMPEDIVYISRKKKWLILPLIFELRKLFIEKEINIVHTYQIESDIFGVPAAYLAGIHKLFSSFESKAIPESISIVKKIFYKIINTFIKNTFIKTIAVSSALKDELINEKYRPADRVEVIHLGFKVPNRQDDYRHSYKTWQENYPLIGSISRLSEEKGFKRFIDAMPFVLKEIPGAKFIIAGIGPQGEELKKYVKDLGLELKVDFPGWIDDSGVIFKALDIFVMPSFREGCPVALLEALSFSKPVVAADIGGISDIIQNQKDGLLVDVSDAKLFAQKIIFLCKNIQKAIEMGESGYEKVNSQFTLEKEISKTKKLYLEAVR